MLIDLVPLVGAIVFFIWMVTDSNVDDNQYGPNPKAEWLGLMRNDLSRWAADRKVAAATGARCGPRRCLAGGIVYALNRGTEEARTLAPWPGADAVRRGGSHRRLDAPGPSEDRDTRCTRDVRIRCAVRRRCGDRVWGGWKPIGGRGSAAIFEHCGRGQSLQQPSGVAQGNCPMSTCANLASSRVIHCRYDSGHDRDPWSDNWILDIETTDRAEAGSRPRRQGQGCRRGPLAGLEQSFAVIRIGYAPVNIRRKS